VSFLCVRLDFLPSHKALRGGFFISYLSSTRAWFFRFKIDIGMRDQWKDGKVFLTHLAVNYAVTCVRDDVTLDLEGRS